MECSDCVVLIARKLDGSLAERESRLLEAHLTECSRCRAELALQRKLVHSLKQEIPQTLPPDFTRQVSRRAGQLARAEGRRRFRLAVLIPAVPLAAAAALLVIFSRDIAGIMAPAMESLAGTIGTPLAAFGESVADLAAGMSVLPGRDIQYPEVLTRVLANSYVAAGIACTAVGWAFSKAYTFVRG
jgi:anti-sigma factor RsiW